MIQKNDALYTGSQDRKNADKYFPSHPIFTFCWASEKKQSYNTLHVLIGEVKIQTSPLVLPMFLRLEKKTEMVIPFNKKRLRNYWTMDVRFNGHLSRDLLCSQFYQLIHGQFLISSSSLVNSSFQLLHYEIWQTLS